MQTTIFLSLISLNSNILYGKIINYPNGDFYDGEVKDGKPDGEGVYIWKDTSSHKGYFKNGLPNGYGVHMYKDGVLHEGYFINDVPNGYGKRIWLDGSFYDGDWANGSFNGYGVHLYVNRDEYSYEGDWLDGKRHGEGELTWMTGISYKGNFIGGSLVNKYVIKNEETKVLLNIESFNEEKITENIEYFYEDGNSNRIVINYNIINRALNRNEINKAEDLKKYIKIFDKESSEIKDQENFDIKKLIKQLAQYQTQNIMKSSNGKLDDENRINNAGNTGVKYSIILSELIDNIEALKRVRFGERRSSPNWLKNMYQNKELFLNSFGLTMNNNLPKNSGLTSIDTLLDNGITYFSVNMDTAVASHAASAIIDLIKLRNNERYFIYGYDTSGVMNGNNNAGNLQENYLIFNHIQQRLGSCAYNSIHTTITGAKYPEIAENIRNGNIKPVKESTRWVEVDTKFNDFENLQKIMIQRVAEHLGVGRLNTKTEDRETYDKIKKGTRMIRLIVSKDVRKVIKENAHKYFEEHNYLNFLKDEKLGTFESLLVIANDRGFDVEGFGPKVEKLLLVQTIAEYFGIGNTTEEEKFSINVKRGKRMMHITAEKDIKYTFKDYTTNNYLDKHLEILKGKKSDKEGLSLTMTNKEKFELEDLTSEIKKLLPSEIKNKLSYRIEEVLTDDEE